MTQGIENKLKELAKEMLEDGDVYVAFYGIKLLQILGKLEKEKR